MKEIVDKHSGAILFKKDPEALKYEELVKRIEELEYRVHELEERINKGT